jgi:phospholipid/cholesterol/gamma-HCH transport system substrate-binding protein
VLNLLGQKYLRLIPAGAGSVAAGAPHPQERTKSGYDIVSTLDQLTDTTGRIDKPQLGKALTTLASTLDSAGPEVGSSFRGLARLSNTIASRDGDITTLMARAQRVTDLLNSRKGDLIDLMKKGSLVFGELLARRQAIHDVLVNARRLGVQLRGLAVDNRAQIGPALAELDKAVTFLNKRKQQLSDTIKYYGPYATILVNIIGTGPWFDAYVPNLAGLGTGEFRPGKRTYPK